ncbi:MAG: hypothetical protein M9962_08650 [Oligoflexia bacterium]|nr:hypothetical protein [Oligoflexia bacterium]
MGEFGKPYSKAISPVNAIKTDTWGAFCHVFYRKNLTFWGCNKIATYADKVVRLLHMGALKKLPKRFVLRSKDLERRLGSRVAIKRETERGTVQSLGAGLYASPSIDPMTAAVIAVAKYYPQAVISGRTALVIHKLSDHAVERIEVDIPKSTRIVNKMLEVHRVAETRLTGISKLELEGTKIKIYDLERALCEAYRLDPAGPEFFTALKRYLKQKESDTKRIKKYDEALGTKVLVHVMQELADG